ncbi:MAG: tRNA pseudouridine(38-40) synthase TruA [Mycetocola sp.]
MSEQLTPTQPVRLRIDLSYDGTDFAGWAIQPGQRTVQGVVEDAIARQFGFRLAPLRVRIAGRTDAGVHASGQVAHVDLEPEHFAALARSRAGAPSPAGVARALYRNLSGVLGIGSDVIIRSVTAAPAGFDARFSANWRRYQYRISDQRTTRDPQQRRRTHWHGKALDDNRLAEAAEVALGLHDFLAFCKPREGATTIRNLQEFRWWRDESDVLIAELRADAFCHSMVRALVGGVVSVGEGKHEADEIRAALESPRRHQFAPAMPATGLDLVEVSYPGNAELLARAELTRARRTLSGPPVVESD